MEYDARYARRAAALISPIEHVHRRATLRNFFERESQSGIDEGLTETTAERIALDKLHCRVPAKVAT
jgi:hypothetical protein